MEKSLASGKVKHQPVENGECSSCHSPHNSENKKLLAKPEGKLCFECHEDTRKNLAAAKVKHQPVENGECSSCHSPHQSENKKLLVKPDAKLGTIAAEKGLKATTSLPFTRHPGQDNAVPPALVPKLFAAKPGEVVTASDATGSYVAQLGDVQKPENVSQSSTADLSRELDAGQQADLGAEFAQALRARFPVEIHREVLDKLF